MLYLEDYRVGDSRVFGRKIVVTDEIVTFATEFDPQPFHVDPEAAKDSEFKGLIASGWHTIAMTCRMFSDNFMNEAALIGGIGADGIRWLKPVRPGMALAVRATVIEIKQSRSKPDRGSLTISLETIDEMGDTVMTMTVIALLRTRT
jgi:acyl dehydratase